ncbi:hypothetical protein L873DRAFT_1314684 [Choiromyces venosus 120613-1]|uniref:Uncharacterized protein n=1 Tax=Choiromyces venosus 120613-1 TaxID=1336337 RepID=A0A3N4JFL8_9PEZI|nr:hypothetical protein L873DRAFT_1314684 [Choiromyces venosus 120613-1]
MPAVRQPLQKLKENDANEQSLPHQGPQPKSLNERKIKLQVEPRQKIKQTYTWQQKIKVLNRLEYYHVVNKASNMVIKMWCPTLDEVSAFFKIPKSTIGRWRKVEVTQKIVQ